MKQVSKFAHLNRVMTTDELQDRMHYVSGVLADLVINGKFEAAKQWATEAQELNARLNQAIPS